MRRANSALDQRKLLAEVKNSLGLVPHSSPDVEKSYSAIAHVVISSVAPRKERRSKPWYDAQCYRAFATLRTEALEVARGPGQTSELSASRTSYRALIRLKKREFQLNGEAKLIEQAVSEPTCGSGTIDG